MWITFESRVGERAKRYLSDALGRSRRARGVEDIDGMRGRDKLESEGDIGALGEE